MRKSIVLGTVQFGIPYGVSNTHGQISCEDGRMILAHARNAGIDTLDTAVAYGESEAALGALGVADWKVITKLPEMPPHVDDVAGWVVAHVNDSLVKLRVKSLHGVLLHRPAQLCGNHGRCLYQALLDQRESGRVSKIGISIYDPADLDQLPSGMRFDIVQAPCNVLDTRMIRSGWVQRLRDIGTEFHARSIFLQGLLLMAVERRPVFFARWSRELTAWDGWLNEHRLTALEACLRFSIGVDGITHLVIGVDSTAHLAQIVDAAARSETLPPLPAEFSKIDPDLINPSAWRLT